MPDEVATPEEAPSNAPPTWSEVKSDPGFSALSPEKQLATFARWHDDSYNYASKQPDWMGPKDPFNQNAYQTQIELSKAAGGITPDQARVKIAQDAIAKASAAGALSPEQERETLKPLGMDVVRAYLNDKAPAPDYSVSHQALNAMREFGSSTGAYIERGLEGLARYAARQAANDPETQLGRLQNSQNELKQMLGEHVDDTEWMKPFAIDPQQFFEDSANFWAKRAQSAGKESDVDPALAETVPATLSRAAGPAVGMAGEAMVSVPLMAMHGAAAAYSEAKENGKPDSAAEMSAVRTLIGLGVFGGTSKLASFGLAKLIPEGAPTIEKFVKQFLGQAGANEVSSRAINAWEAANNAPPGERVGKALQVLTGPQDAETETFNLLYAGMGASHAAGSEGKIAKAEADTDAAKLEQSGAPQTAEAVREISQQDLAAPAKAGQVPTATGEAPAAEEPPIKLMTHTDQSGAQKAVLSVQKGATPEQIQEFAKQTKEHSGLPPAAQAEFDRQIAEELKARGVTPPAPEAQAPAAEGKEAASTIAGPALVDEAGKVLVEGKVGETHADLLNMMKGSTNEDKILEAFTNDKQHVFLDNSGKVLSREEAAPVAIAAGQAPEGTTALRSQDLRARQEAAIGKVKEMVSQRPAGAAPPSQRAVAAAGYVPPTVEEHTLAVEKGTKDVTDTALKTGLIPSRAEIVDAVGRKEATKLEESLRTQVEAQYPPEELAKGAKETSVKHEGTGTKLPQVIEADGKVRPKFTNDPDLTAQQIDMGMVSTGKTNRMYLPDELVDEDKINPAIQFSYDKAAGQYYVTGVDTQYGHITDPDQYVNRQREATTFSKAHQMISLPPDTLSFLAERGAPPELFDDSLPGEGAVVRRGEGVKDPTLIMANLSELERLGVWQRQLGGARAVSGMRPAGSYATLVDALLKDPKLTAGQREMARLLKNSGVQPAKVHVVLQPDAKASGWYNPDSRDLFLNAAARHEGGISSTALHESYHHVTLEKIDNPKTPAEKQAVENIQKLRQHMLGEVFRNTFNREGTPKELEAFAKAQTSDAKDVPEEMKEASARTWYGLSDDREFVTEIGTNPKFQALASHIEAPKNIKPLTLGARFRNLLDLVKQSIKELFVGGPVPMRSVLDHALDAAQSLVREPPRTEEPARAPPAESKAPKQSREELEAAVKEKLPDTDVMTMTTAELRDALGGIVPPEEAKPTVPNGPGWLSPKGEFIPAEASGEGVKPPLELDWGGHEKAALSHLETKEPELAKKLTAQAKEEGGLDWQTVSNFMEKNGFVRIAGGGEGQTIYITGRPTAAQRRALMDAAAEQKSDLVHDLQNGKARTLYSPSNAFALPQSPESTVSVITDYRDGKAAHSLKISPDASRGDLLQMSETIDKGDLPVADKERLKQQIATILGPTMTVRQAKGKVVVGYDSINNIANVYARQKAAAVALDFGSWKKPSPEALADRNAMPFVIEAAGSREELMQDLDRINNSKDPELAKEYAPIVQHAIDNFDRLDAKKETYQKVIKEQLERMRANGINVGELENYVTRMLELPEHAKDLLPASPKGDGSTRYFTKGRVFEKLSDAINAGYSPRSEGRAAPTDIVELTQRYMEMSERLVQQKAFEKELRTVKTPSGLPVIGNVEEYESLMGDKDTRIPRGYSMIQTGAKPLVINNEMAPMFKALYGDSTFPDFLRTAAGLVKRNTLIFDTYHVGRIMFKELGYSKGANRVGWNKGLSILEYSDADLQKALDAGDINKSMMDYSREKIWNDMTRRDVTELMLKQGLNVGRVADNLYAQHAAAIPWIRDFNPWVFQKLSRGAMLQTALENFTRNMDRFPERGLEGNARQTATESNEVFGNLQSQTMMFKSKTYQDAIRAAVLAPQWAESQVRAELRGYGQLAKAPIDLLKGKARLGTVAQGQLTVVLGMLAANQLINYMTTGHSTFENKDGSHLLDAFIPGGKRGFWFNPFEIGAEYAFMASRYYSQHMTPIDALVQIAKNKLGPLGRGATEFLTGRDYAGRKFNSLTDRVRGSLLDSLPFPIGLSGLVEKDPRQPLGVRMTRQPGATEKQLLQSAGLKVAAEFSPRAHMFALAYPFRADKSYRDEAGEYTELRRALDNDQLDAVRSEINMLVSKGKTYDQLRAAVGINKDGSIKPETFAGTESREHEFKKALSPDQMATYKEAQKDHHDNANKLRTLLTEMRPEIAQQLATNKKLHK